MNQGTSKPSGTPATSSLNCSTLPFIVPVLPFQFGRNTFGDKQRGEKRRSAAMFTFGGGQAFFVPDFRKLRNPVEFRSFNRLEVHGSRIFSHLIRGFLVLAYFLLNLNSISSITVQTINEDCMFDVESAQVMGKTCLGAFNLPDGSAL